jgi:hypothetical protein
MQPRTPAQRPLHHQAQRPAPTPHRASPARQRRGTRRSKKDSTQMHSGCTQSTRMGLKLAWSFTADIAQPNPASRADAVAPVPSACSASIRLHLRKTLLASPRAAPGPREPGSCTHCQNPMHQFRTAMPPSNHAGARVSRQHQVHRENAPPRRATGLRTPDRQPEPHAPIRPPAAAGPSEQTRGRQHQRAARTPCTNSRHLFRNATP